MLILLHRRVLHRFPSPPKSEDIKHWREIVTVGPVHRLSMIAPPPPPEATYTVPFFAAWASLAISRNVQLSFYVHPVVSWNSILSSTRRRQAK